MKSHPREFLDSTGRRVSLLPPLHLPEIGGIALPEAGCFGKLEAFHMYERDHSQLRADMQGRSTTGPRPLDVTTMSCNWPARQFHCAGRLLLQLRTK